MAPVDGAIKVMPASLSRGMMASVWGVPRVKNKAITLLSAISFFAFSAASAGSNLSSIDTNSIF